MTKETCIEYKSISDTCGQIWYGELSLEEVQVRFLMDLNNFGYVEKLIEVKTTVVNKDANGLRKRIRVVVETEIDMTEKIEAYKKNFGGLRSEGHNNPHSI